MSKNINLNTEEEKITCDCFLDDEEAKYETEATGLNNVIPDETVVLEEKTKSVPQEKNLTDAGVQVKSVDLLGNCFLDFLKTDKELSTATRIQSFEIFDSIVAAVKIAAPQLKNCTRILSIRERVLITFMKLKQNLSYSFISILFPTVTVRFCLDITCNMID